MTVRQSCAHCGTPLHPAVLSGHCPTCVIRNSLDFARVVPIADSPVADRLRLPPFRTPALQRWGDYELISEIARGGMGVVYRARQISLNRMVALKVLLSGQFADADQVERFRKEARAVAILDHPGIVPIYEVGEFEGRNYLSMKLVEGRSLASMMGEFDLAATRRRTVADGRTPGPALKVRQRELALLLAEIARAVHYAHQRGVLHRDLKPGNILIDTGGRPHVTDFGLARLIGEEKRITKTDAVVGTPSYMPPEQTFAPREVTVAADVYSIGAIGYELMAGRPPFEAGNAMETLIQLREQEPTPPHLIEPALVRDLETILLKCLSKEPSLRYDSALELAEDLERFVRGEPVHARPVRPHERAWRWARRHPAVAILSTTVTLLVLGVAVGAPLVAVQLARDRQSAEQARQRALQDLRQATLARAEAERLTAETGIREDGLRAVSEAARIRVDPAALNEGIAQWVRLDVQRGKPDRRRGGPDLPLVVSPDFATVFLAAPGGSVEARLVADDSLLWTWQATSTNRIADLHASADGEHLLVTRRGELEILRLSTRESVSRIPIVDFLRLSPDGSWFLVLDRGRQVQRYETATGQKLGTLALPAVGLGDVAICPDPEKPWIAVITGNWIEIMDWQQGRTITSLYQPTRCGDLVWSGEWLAGAAPSGIISVWHLPSGKHHFITGHRAAMRNIEFMPGTRVLVTTGLDGLIHYWDAASGDRLLTASGAIPIQFAPDGRRLVSGTPTGWSWTEILPPVGRSQIDCRDDGDELVRDVQFSEDGRWILVTKQAGIHVIDCRRGTKTHFTRLFGAVQARFVAGTRQLIVQGRSAVYWFTFDRDLGRIMSTPSRIYGPQNGRAMWLERGAFSPDGQYLDLFLLDGSRECLRLKDGVVETAGQYAPLTASPQIALGGVNAVYWSARDSQMKHLNLEDGSTAGILRETGATPLFSPDGRHLLLSGLMNHQIFAVESWTSLRLQQVRGRLAGRPPPGSWTSDSEHLALTVDRNRIALQSVFDRSAKATLTTPQPNAYTVLQFSPGRRWLAAGTDSAAVEIWDLYVLQRGLEELHLPLNWPVSETERQEPGVAQSYPSGDVPGQSELPKPIRGIAPRHRDATPAQLDLGSFFNAALAPDSNDKSGLPDHFASMPTGILESRGIRFEIRGLLQLTGERRRRDTPNLPVAITNIPVQQTTRRLHLIGAVSDAPPSILRPTVVARVRIRYRDGETRELPLRLGEELEDYWSPVRSPKVAHNASLAWTSLSTSSERSANIIQLQHITLDNPRPDDVIEALDLVSTETHPAPFFLAITLE